MKILKWFIYISILILLSPVLSFAQLPANDECAGAINIPVSTGSTSNAAIVATTGNATQSLASCYGTVSKDVWYKFTATAQTHRVMIRHISYCDLAMQFYSVTCGQLVAGYCSYPAGNDEPIYQLYISLLSGKLTTSGFMTGMETAPACNFLKYRNSYRLALRHFLFRLNEIKIFCAI